MDRSIPQNPSGVSSMRTSASMGASDVKKSPWINAWKDAVIGLKAYSQCIQLSDLRGDGDYKLVVGAHQKKLVAYKGASLDWEAPVSDIPIAVASFYAETAKIPQPNIAVAAESSIYLYKNLKPYFKFNLPGKEWRREEMLLWNQFTPAGLKEFVAALAELKNQNLPLSSRAHEVLNLTTPEKQLALIQIIKAEPLSTPDVVTCMESIKKNSEDEMAISQLVVGTEQGEIIFLDPSGTTVLRTVSIPGTPAFMDVSGLFDTDYQIIVITRESKGFIIRNGELGNFILELESKPCGIAKVDQNLFVGTMDSTVQAISLKTLKKSFSIKMPDPIVCIESMEKGRSKSLRGYFVALANMELRMYNEKQLIYSVKCDDVIAGMKYGTFGREDGALVILYNRLGLDVKILQRQFNFSASSQALSQFQEPDQPFNMPKKTKLFIEQSQRERDQAAEMYRTYMKDLFRMRLKIAQNYIKGIKEGATQAAGGAGLSIKIHAQVEGIGPLFKIRLELENLDRLPAYNLKLSYAYDSSIYKMLKCPMDLPVMVPGFPYPIEIFVENVDPNGTNDTVKIFVLEKTKNIPVVTAVVNMPISEINVE